MDVEKKRNGHGTGMHHQVPEIDQRDNGQRKRMHDLRNRTQHSVDEKGEFPSRPEVHEDLVKKGMC